jgi:hypothetical protein
VSSPFPDPVNADFARLAFVNAYRKGVWERLKVASPGTAAFSATAAGADVQDSSLWAGLQLTIEGIATSFLVASYAGWVGKPFWYLNGGDIAGHAGTDPHYTSFTHLCTDAGYSSGGWIRERPRVVAGTFAASDEMGNAAAAGQKAWVAFSDTVVQKNPVGPGWTPTPFGTEPDRLSSERGEVPYGRCQPGDYISPTMFRQIARLLSFLNLTMTAQLQYGLDGYAETNEYFGTGSEGYSYDATLEHAESAAFSAYALDFSAGGTPNHANRPEAMTQADYSTTGVTPPLPFGYTANTQRYVGKYQANGVDFGPGGVVTRSIVWTASEMNVDPDDSNVGLYLFDQQGNSEVQHLKYFKFGSTNMSNATHDAISPLLGSGGVPSNFDPPPCSGNSVPTGCFGRQMGWRAEDTGHSLVRWNFEWANGMGGLAGLGPLMGML